jgi:hypothetical protein
LEGQVRGSSSTVTGSAQNVIAREDGAKVETLENELVFVMQGSTHLPQMDMVKEQIVKAADVGEIQPSAVTDGLASANQGSHSLVSAAEVEGPGVAPCLVFCQQEPPSLQPLPQQPIPLLGATEGAAPPLEDPLGRV